MTNRQNKKKTKQGSSLAKKLSVVIVILLIVVAAIGVSGMYIVKKQSGSALPGPVAKLEELIGRDRKAQPPVGNVSGAQALSAAAEDPEQSGTAGAAAATGTEDPEQAGTQAAAAAEDAPQLPEEAQGTDAQMPGSVGEKAHDEDVVTYGGKQYRYNDHLSNYLMLGIDTKGDIQLEKRSISAGQSDAMYLVSYDRREETVQILAIPRDTMTEIQLYNEDGEYLSTAVDHLTLQYAYGDGKRKSCELTCDAVSHLLYELPIRGYASLNTESIPLLADVVDGVPITVPDNSLQDVDPRFTRGDEIVIDTENAELFLRHRDTHQHQQALVRMDRQKVFIKGFVQKLKELQSKDAHTITDVYETLKPHMVTNMTNDVFADLAMAQQEGRIETIPGKGVNTELYDEYEVDEKALYEQILTMFYKEVEE